jgi:hypothetical protein
MRRLTCQGGTVVFSVADPGCLIPDTGSDNFLISNPGFGSKHFFIAGAYMKSGMQTYFFLDSYAFRTKVPVLVLVKKTWDPESEIRKKFIPDPDPWDKKAPDPGSATMV